MFKLTVDRVYIDIGREAPNRKQYLYKENIPIEEKRLEIGDYLVGDYIIEYKSWTDFYASMTDGRLWTQLANMKQYDHPLVAVVGDKYKSLYKMSNYRRGRQHFQPEDSIRNGLVTIYKSFGIPIMMFENDEDFCKFVATLYKSLNKEKRKYRPVFHKRKPKSLKEVKENLFAEIPNISIGKSKLILENNDYSIMKVLGITQQVNVEKLQEIKGIGNKITEQLEKVFK